MNLLNINLTKKPTLKKIAEDIDFYSLFQSIEQSYETCFLLESLREENPDSRYSIIGFKPEKIIKAKGKTLFIDSEKHEVDNPYQTLSENFPKPFDSNQPYAGGLVGFLGYESVNYFEPKLNLSEHGDFPTFCFGLYLDGLILDRMTGEISYYFYQNDRSEEIQKIISNLKNIKIKVPKVTFLGDTRDKEDHEKEVNKAVEEIKKGNAFQVEVGFKTEFKIEGSSLPIYSELRKINPSPYMYYLKFGNQKLLGASPELLFRLEDGVMETFPLAGTAPRGKTETEDRKLAKDLLNNPKEIAEHNMLVDLHRNDLGRVAKFGTVKVRRLMDIKKFSHVQHISSEIMGIIDPKENMFTGLASNFPAGTLSGAPKIEAIGIISRSEKTARGPYGGAVGHFGFKGDCTFCIPIRSLFISDDYGYAQTSGGIVYDSDPEKEYQEIRNKLAATKKVLEKFKIN